MQDEVWSCPQRMSDLILDSTDIFLKGNSIEVRGKTDNGKSDSSKRGQTENLHNLLCCLFPFLRKGHTTPHSRQHAIKYSQDSI